MELRDLTKAMSECDQEASLKLVSDLARQGINVNAILDSLTQGLKILGERFSAGEAFIPELVFAGEIFNEARKVLDPHMPKGQVSQMHKKGKVVIATVKGDLHDIGKNLVATFLSLGGYEVIDLGVDVPNEKLIEVIQSQKPRVIGLSSLLTTTMLSQRQFMAMLKERGLRDQVKVIVGGAPVTQDWANEIGADAFGADAVDGKNKIDALMG
ncbi:MAG TPA: cobalamin-dependent protein [Thermodesulfobacteriota bacterium]|nr:cobalamin-dependent protein [Thermodesulfobacteriota bacterium]